MNVRPTARPALFDFPLLGVGGLEGETVPGTVRVGVEGEVTVGDRVKGGMVVDGNSGEDDTGGSDDGEGTMVEDITGEGVVIDDVITVVLTAAGDEKSDVVRVGSMTETVEELLADCPATQAARNTTKIEAMLGPRKACK